MDYVVRSVTRSRRVQLASMQVRANRSKAPSIRPHEQVTKIPRRGTTQRHDTVIAACRPGPVTARRIQDVLCTNGMSASKAATEDLTSLSLLSRLGGE